MPNYKGVITLLKDIPPNSPVEIVDESVLWAQTKWIGEVGVPKFGVIVRTVRNYGEGMDVTFYQWVKDAEGMKRVELNSAKYNPHQWSGMGLTGTCNAFKVLTGVRGREISAKWAEEFVKTAPFPSYGGQIGFDPEIFVTHGDGSVFPAWEFLPAKNAGIKFSNRTLNPGQTKKDWVYGCAPGDTGAAFWDGFQAEFSVTEGSCVSNVVDSVRMGLITVLREAKKVDPEAALTLTNTVRIEPEVLENAADVHAALGCSPSKNAYGVSGETVDNPRALPFRFAGGHVHLGNTAYHTIAPQVVKALDAILGVACVAMFEGVDNPLRRRFYGLAGEYRLPKWGLEYRTLSNAWLSHPVLMMIVSDVARDAASIGAEGTLTKWTRGYSEARIQAIINTCDVVRARAWVKENEALYARIVAKRWLQPNALEVFLKLVYEGAGSLLDLHNFDYNWLLSANRVPFNSGGMNKPGGPTEEWMDHCESAGRNFVKLCIQLQEKEQPLVEKPLAHAAAAGALIAAI